MVTFGESLHTSALCGKLGKGRPLPKPLRGSVRLLEAMGHGALTEFPLKSGRRADILSLGPKGEIWIVEVKSGVPDFRSDHKWQDYLEWCDRFFFAVDSDFPTGILPSGAGLLIADEYEAVLTREPETIALPGGRRKALTLRFAHLAARRLSEETILSMDSGRRRHQPIKGRTSFRSETKRAYSACAPASASMRKR